MSLAFIYCVLGVKLYPKWTIVVTISLATCFLVWALISTLLPLYILDRLNLRQYFLPDIACENCNNFTYNYLVTNENFCNKSGINNDIFLLIMVASHHPNIKARTTIRSTRGGVHQHKGLNIKTIFVFGTHTDRNLNKQVQQEMDLYGDVVQADFTDKYHTLTNKTMVGLQWILRYCPQAKFVLKTDDDAFNVPQRYVDYLIDTHLDILVGGHCFTKMPTRSPCSKYYIPESMYPNYHYPTYCSGPGYLLSNSAVHKIVDISSNVIFLPIEDIYITGMCRLAAKIQYVQVEGTMASKQDMNKFKKVTWVKNSHRILPEEALQIWRDNIVNPGDKIKDCPSIESAVRLSYALPGIFLIWINMFLATYIFNRLYLLKVRRYKSYRVHLYA